MVFFYPGQGSQFIGMGTNLMTYYSVAGSIFEQANDTLGFDLKKLCFQGPESELTDTKNAQPAIITYQYILTKILKEKGYIPTVAAGHSLGEFSALLAAEMLSFEDTLKIVRKRGELMAACDPEQKGSMTAILGLNDQQVVDICQEISKTAYVEPVNFNAPGQIVISGLKEGVQAASEKALELGASKIVPLAVSGAFHSRLMDDAAYNFKEFISNFTIKEGICPVASDVTAEFYITNQAKELLALQIKKPVQWVKIVTMLYDKGYNEGIEVNQSSIIRGLVRKINKDFKIHSIDSILSL
ncbi:[acyl-carrier-protein] S-malonyltransferase [Brevinema andersonii]|uniref:Malonyl CoA-acyl carrier protein transacylase n=1 Tax=Brevinema andersonii TaxID=34097 RepID=A0A1I1CY81_BREAD|nr:ACP S-malonyltransferase [Brevinema andersonii]SFB67006.1 [acyl-carrier-protein] S-malonyltransferase [Brevinema andersonii]